MSDLDDTRWFAFNPFRMLRIRPAASEEIKSYAPRQSQQMTIVSRTHRRAIASLLSGLEAPTSPRQPHVQGAQRRSKVAA
jgi:hypothetical protein